MKNANNQPYNKEFSLSKEIQKRRTQEIINSTQQRKIHATKGVMPSLTAPQPMPETTQPPVAASVQKETSQAERSARPRLLLRIGLLVVLLIGVGVAVTVGISVLSSQSNMSVQQQSANTNSNPNSQTVKLDPAVDAYFGGTTVQVSDVKALAHPQSLWNGDQEWTFTITVDGQAVEFMMFKYKPEHQEMVQWDVNMISGPRMKDAKYIHTVDTLIVSKSKVLDALWAKIKGQVEAKIGASQITPMPSATPTKTPWPTYPPQGTLPQPSQD